MNRQESIGLYYFMNDLLYSVLKKIFLPTVIECMSFNALMDYFKNIFGILMHL